MTRPDMTRPGMTRAGLGIDAGGTGTRWVVVDENGSVLASGFAAPLSGHLYNEQSQTQACQILDDIAQAAHRSQPITGCKAGITGLSPESDIASLLRDTLSQSLGLAPTAISLREDIYLLARSHFRLGEGIVVYAGTGSIAYHLTESGQTVRLGGHGLLLDDKGSGAWIGREALARILMQEEMRPGSGWHTPLGQALAGLIGATDWGSIRRFVYGGDRGTLARLAPAVAESAGQNDALAMAILARAGDELALLATGLWQRLGSQPVALCGGAAFLHPIMYQRFCEGLPAGAAVRATQPDAAYTAACLAAGGKLHHIGTTSQSEDVSRHENQQSNV